MSAIRHGGIIRAFILPSWPPMRDFEVADLRPPLGSRRGDGFDFLKVGFLGGLRIDATPDIEPFAVTARGVCA